MAELENDEHHGVGGSYLLDPETGKRKLVERTKEAAKGKTGTVSRPAKPAPAAQPLDEEKKD